MPSVFEERSRSSLIEQARALCSTTTEEAFDPAAFDALRRAIGLRSIADALAIVEAEALSVPSLVEPVAGLRARLAP